MLKKKLIVPIYRNRFTVVFYKEHKEIEEFFKGKGFTPPTTCDGYMVSKEDEVYLCFWADKGKDVSAGTIAHEAKHLVNYIFIDIGADLDRYNDEPECYLLGWIVNEIYKIKDKFYKL